MVISEGIQDGTDGTFDTIAFAELLRAGRSARFDSR
jgi:hypothetical protein